MHLKSIELSGFKSFGKKTELVFGSTISSIVGPNGSGKSNVADGFRYVLGEQSMKSLRGKKGEDMIWGGSPALPRANRASAKVTFNNKPHSGKRLLDVDFDEVVVERVVYRDGLNEYLLNGSQVRLKDIIRLLAGANIAGTGYHIISQGEADRILNASPRERREMVEDALGLKLYQHKKAESEKKLDETANNVEKTKSLRREIAPHLNFLRLQVEKIEKSRDMKEELKARLHEYLAREDRYLHTEEVRLKDEIEQAESSHKSMDAALKSALQVKAKEKPDTSVFDNKLSAKEDELRSVRAKRDDLTRELGRKEGALEATKRIPVANIGQEKMRSFVDTLEAELSAMSHETNIEAIRTKLHAVLSNLGQFKRDMSGGTPVRDVELENAVQNITNDLAQLVHDERRLQEELNAIRDELRTARESVLVAEKETVEYESRSREALSRLNSVKKEWEIYQAQKIRFEEEVREGIALLGSLMIGWEKTELPPITIGEERTIQEKRRRDIERLKIKIEEAGIGNGDQILREFKTTKERDEFLAKELADLEASAVSLRQIISELDRTIDEHFVLGLEKINHALNIFFSKLFGGGTAKLEIEEPKKKVVEEKNEDEDEEMEVVPDEEEIYSGLGISVSLPRKKVRGLEVLSGGERALTSIAMIFSMTQVNPPPFLILDETDAALDEANSKRYADMIQELGSKSQLIVITHNRATMAAAGELFGVTMGSDGVSKLLSVKLEEAEKVAK